MVSHNSEKVHIMMRMKGASSHLTITTLTVLRKQYWRKRSNISGEDRDILSAKTSLEISKPKIGLNVYKTDENGSFVLDNLGRRILEKKGSIFMEVEIKAEKFDETNVNVYEGQELPAKKNREAKTFLTLKDGEIVALGGLQEAQYDSTTAKYRFLSDIPYFGEKFFTPNSTKYTPTELLIFIKPTIVDPDDDNIDRVVNRIEESSDLINQKIKMRSRPIFNQSSSFLMVNPTI